MKIILNIIAGILIFNNIAFSQQVFEIYKDDSLQMYFNELTYKDKGYYDYNRMKDSLPNGKYIFYDVPRNYRKRKNIEISGQYKNYRKEGKFETCYYVYNKKTKINELRCYEGCNYKDGKKDGVEVEYILCPYGPYPKTVMQFYGEYVEGKKHGLFMEYEQGFPVSVIVYENDSVKQVLLGKPPSVNSNFQINNDRDGIFDHKE